MSTPAERLLELIPTRTDAENTVTVLGQANTIEEYLAGLIESGGTVDTLQALLPITQAMFAKNIFPTQQLEGLVSDIFNRVIVGKYFSGAYSTQPYANVLPIIVSGDLTPGISSPTPLEARDFQNRAVVLALTIVKEYLFQPET